MPSSQASSRALEIGVRGGSIALEIVGEGLPLVLLHGWALDRRVWEPQVAALAAAFQVIAVDRRGFGRSTAPPNLAGEVDDLVVIRKVLGLPRMAIAGMSQAGRIALQFALAHPDGTSALILQGAPLDGFLPGPRPPEAIPLASYSALARAGELERMKSLWRRHPLMRATPACRELLDRLLADYGGRDLLAPAPSPLVSIAGSLEDVYCPTLVVTGEHDTPWRQLVADALVYGIPNAARATVPGAGHLCNLTHPDAFNDLVANFLSRIENQVIASTASDGGSEE